MEINLAIYRVYNANAPPGGRRDLRSFEGQTGVRI